VNIVTMMFGVAMFLLGTFTTSVWAAPGIELLWIPVLILLQALFTYGLVLILATMQVFLRDTMQVVSIAVTVWMFLTPLFWVPEAIPQIAQYQGFIEANPMNHLVYAWREVLMGVQGVLGEVLNYTNGLAIPDHNGKLLEEINRLISEGMTMEAARASVGPDLVPLQMTHDLIDSVRIFTYWAVGMFVIGFSFFSLAQRRFADEV
jgi:hypothetical protein